MTLAPAHFAATRELGCLLAAQKSRNCTGSVDDRSARDPLSGDRHSRIGYVRVMAALQSQAYAVHDAAAIAEASNRCTVCIAERAGTLDNGSKNRPTSDGEEAMTLRMSAVAV